MIQLIKYIDPLSLRSFITSTRSIKITSTTCTLESKYGSVIFDFKDYSDVEYCIINFRKESGNGAIIINSIDKIISSIREENVKILFTDNKQIIINRPLNSKGEVSILSVSLYSDNESDIKVINWKILLKQFTKYTGLRVVNGVLFANESAYLEPAEIIKVLTTNPPNKFTVIDNSIKFISACEITNIELSETKFIPNNKQLYQHMNEPDVIVSFKNKENINNNLIITNSNQKGKMTEVADESNIIVYDSKTDLGLSSLRSLDVVVDKPSSSMIFNGNKAFINIPMLSLRPYTDYIFTVKIHSINGNGKFGVRLTTLSDFLRDEGIIISIHLPQNFSFTFNTGRPANNGDSYVLQLYRAEGSTGNVVVHQCIVVGSVIEKLNNINYSQPTYNTNLNLISEIEDPVFSSAKKYSRYQQINSEEKFENINGTISFTTVSHSSWFNKIQAVFPNIKIDQNPDISICGAGNIIKNKKIYIDPFINLSDEELEILNDVDIIYSPSVSNIEYLKEKVKSKIIHTFRPWIYVKPKCMDYFLNKKYIIAFHRDNKTTENIINSWNFNLSELVIVGARGNISATNMNEYIPYDKLLYVIFNSQCIIDLPEQNYTSAALHIANAAGVPVINSLDYINTCENKHHDMSEYNTYVASVLSGWFSE